MFLSAVRIAGEVQSGRLRIEPFDPNLLKPASYQLRLGRAFKHWRPSTSPLRIVDHTVQGDDYWDAIEAEEIEIRWGDCMLARTLEVIGLPSNLVGLLSTTSHLARFGLSVHCSSLLVSPGFGSRVPTALTLELTLARPGSVVLTAGMPVCHIALATLDHQDLSQLQLGRSIYEGLEQPAAPAFIEEYDPSYDPSR